MTSDPYRFCVLCLSGEHPKSVHAAAPCQDCGYPYTQPAGACTLCPECGSSSGYS